MLQNLEDQERDTVKDKNAKARRWAFTWHNYTDEDVKYLKEIPKDKCDYVIAGFEKCPETNRPHLQGYIEFGSPLTIGTAKGRLDPKRKTKSPVHISPAFKNRQANINYCSKSETKDAEASEKHGGDIFEVCHKAKEQGKRTDWHNMHDFIINEPDFAKFAEIYPEAAIKHHAGIDRLIRATKEQIQKKEFEEQFDDCTLLEWQKKLADELTNFKPNDRKIIWYYDTTNGHKGKSWMSRYLVAKHKAARFENASSKDIALAYDGEEIVCFDYCRTSEERINYQILESLKNGILFSAKYNSCSKYFKSPHLICFANWLPNFKAMSPDRWDIRCLDNINIEKSNCLDNNTEIDIEQTYTGSNETEQIQNDIDLLRASGLPKEAPALAVHPRNTVQGKPFTWDADEKYDNIAEDDDMTIVHLLEAKSINNMFKNLEAEALRS